jgi:uncharacterized membrane protein YoaT (DUF817 family)
LSKLGSWYLLIIISFVLVASVRRSSQKVGDREGAV